MNWTFFLAKKYLRLSLRSSVFPLMIMTTLGLSLGVATLTLTQAVLSGFQKVFHESILGFNAHLVVLKRSEMQALTEERKQIEGLLGEQLASDTPFLYREGLAISGGKVQGLLLKGMDPSSFDKVYQIKLQSLSSPEKPTRIADLLVVKDASKTLPNMVLGKDIAAELGVLEKKSAQIKVFLPKNSDLSSRDNFQIFNVAGIFISGLYEYDHGFGFVDLNTLQTLYQVPNQATGFEIKLKDPSRAELLAEQIQKELGFYYDAVSWQRLNGPLFKALQLERVLFFVIIAMVVWVAAFNIIGILLLMVFDKSRDISIFRALGANFNGIKRVFGLQGLMIGTTGSVLGVLLGSAVAWFLNKTQIFRLAKEVYLVERLPVNLSPWVIATVVLLSILISYLATQLALLKVKKTPLDL